MHMNETVPPILNAATRDYVLQHRQDDVRQLALKGSAGADVDRTMALQQISGWQTARRKLPTWAAAEDIIYPPHLSMEQCSSELTARYKAPLAAFGEDGRGGSLVDLTGGFGVDFSFMARGRERAVYVERDAHLCRLARHNFDCLGLTAEVVCASAEDYLRQMSPVDVIFMDPARRDDHGGRTYGIADCTPNVLDLLPLLRQKTRRLLLKLSPMLDWHKAVSDLAAVSAVHIVSVENDCKELIVEVSFSRCEVRGTRCETSVSRCEVRGSRCENTPSAESEVREYTEGMSMHCVNLLSDGAAQHFSHLVPRTSYLEKGTSYLEKNTSYLEKTYLYTPNASIMKAGCFDEIADFYHLCELSANSHLFISTDEIADFPGRCFRIEAVTSLNKHELKPLLATTERANIATRNFPLTPDALRRRLKLKDGGDLYLFATTLADGSHKLLWTRKNC